MNIKSLTLSILSITALGIAVSQPTLAQSAPGARFSFAPHTYKLDDAPPPPRYNSAPQANVRAGGVPHGSNFLGLDPGMLAKSAPVTAPVATVMARPVFTSAVPQLIPHVPQAFKSAFGNPISAPVVASLPEAMHAQPMTGRPMTGRPMTPSKSQARSAVSANKSVSGTLLNRKHAYGRSAGPASAMSQQVASYGRNMGYTPGTFVPTATGSGMSTQAVVSGRLMSRH